MVGREHLRGPTEANIQGNGRMAYRMEWERVCGPTAADMKANGRDKI